MDAADKYVMGGVLLMILSGVLGISYILSQDKKNRQKLQQNYLSITQIGQPEYKDFDGIKGNETYMKIGDKLYSVMDSCGTAKLVPYNGLEGKTEGKNDK